MEDITNINDNINIREELILNIVFYNPLYQLFTEQISALESIKLNPNFSKSLGVNLMYIPVLTMFTESFLSELIGEHLQNEKRESSDNLKVNLIKKLEERAISGWKDYQEVFQLVFTTRFENIVEAETLKAMGFLFQLRNKIIHGETFCYTREKIETEEEGFSFGESYKNLHQYFIEKKLIDKNNMSLELVTDQVVEHFLTNCINFTKKIIVEINKKHPLMMLELYNAHVIEKL